MINTDSKKIVSYLLEQVLSVGDLRQDFTICYKTLANELGLQNERYCRVCCQYLHRLNYIELFKDQNKNYKVRLTAKGIDFLENTL